MEKPKTNAKPDTPKMPRTSLGEDNFKLLSIFKAQVPKDYNPGTILARFKERHEVDFDFYQNNINDENFSTATQYLVPGKLYVVKIFRSARIYNTDEALQFYASQNALLVGAQGYVLSWPRLKKSIPKGMIVVSLDEAGVLMMAKGRPRITLIEHFPNDLWRIFVGHFSTDWSKKTLLLCVCEAET